MIKKESIKESIAVILFKLGFKPRCTSFIDEETMSYGYGKLNGDIGVWEYQLPFNITKKKLEEEELKGYISLRKYSINNNDTESIKKYDNLINNLKNRLGK